MTYFSDELSCYQSMHVHRRTPTAQQGTHCSKKVVYIGIRYEIKNLKKINYHVISASYVYVQCSTCDGFVLHVYHGCIGG